MSPLTFSKYGSAALLTDLKRTSDPSLCFPLLGLFGETGSLLSEVKKKQRDPVAYVGYEESVCEELGDVIWYLNAVADRAGFTLSDLAINLDCERDNWQTVGRQDIAFADVELEPQNRPRRPSAAFAQSSIRLAAEVGLLLTDYRAGRLEQNRSALKGRLIAVFRALRHAANDAGLSLERAAVANLVKIADRWPVERVYPALFDEAFPMNEQLPRKLHVTFEEVEQNGKLVSRMTREGVPIGDPLTDNRTEDDDYRFHDVFHLAHAAFLGWSPTLRRLLGVKRKSRPAVDEVEDGARAILIEEGIATWIFNHARRLAHFDGLSSLDYGLLKSIRQFVLGYEVESCPLWLWEETILKGYDVFRKVCEHRGGQVRIDLAERKIQFAEP